ACACPGCGSPMSIRLWLRLADCWRCGASVALSERQEREAWRLLKQREDEGPPPPGPMSRPDEVPVASKAPTTPLESTPVAPPATEPPSFYRPPVPWWQVKRPLRSSPRVAAPVSPPSPAAAPDAVNPPQDTVQTSKPA
ncbi:MAG: hypothetical protein AB7O38_31340, partial [Pirellulaceae bacterium]